MAHEGPHDRNEQRRLEEVKRLGHKSDYTGPVKQWVRRHAWLPLGQARLEMVKDQGAAEYLTYFTLCAEKAIDVRLFWIEDLLQFNGHEYPGVVFCECSPESYEMIASRLGRTKGFRAFFEDLVLGEDAAKSVDFYSSLHFDVYNLDFTGVCFPNSDPPYSKTLAAIVTLIQRLGEPPYQRGFDMLLTFRAQRSMDNDQAVTQLKSNIRDNRRRLAWFDDLFRQRYSGDMAELIGTYHEFLLVALPKFLGRVAKASGFGVRCPFRVYYPRPDAERPEYHIVSFGLSFEWVGTTSQVRPSVRQQVPSEEITADYYFGMMRQIIEGDIVNVESVRFARDRYKREVEDLLALIEET